MMIPFTLTCVCVRCRQEPVKIWDVRKLQDGPSAARSSSYYTCLPLATLRAPTDLTSWVVDVSFPHVGHVVCFPLQAIHDLDLICQAGQMHP